MKKQNNILTYIAKITYSVALVASLYACTDEEVSKNNYIEEGIPVELSMDFASPEMTTLTTRGLDEDQESQVNDLYLFIFDKEGATKKAGSGIYRDVTANKGKITIKTTSGESLIYGIANVEGNQQENLLTKLNNVNSLKELNECFIAGTIEGAIDVDRTTPNLVMSGAYMNPTYTSQGMSAGYCRITPGATTLTGGRLELMRLDSHIKFNIHTGSKVSKIEPKEWQVLNVPKQSFLLVQGKTNSGGTTQSCYANSHIYNNQTIHKEIDSKNSEKEMHTFSFYQFENFKNAKSSLTEENKYKREEEDKNTDGSNTGVYKHVEPCATSVEFKAYLEFTTNRVADIKVTILLGGLDPGESVYDFRNFNTWRNKKYIYNVTINDVNDIVTEVEMKEENRPGIEGDVIDAEDKVRVLDAHYNCFNIALTAAQVKKMSIMVHTPFDQVDFVADETHVTPSPEQPGKKRDYHWIKFKRTPNNDKTLLANYAILNKGNDDSDNQRLDIFTLREDVLNRANEEAGGDSTKVFYYTVFVDEYYYTEVPRTGLDWGSDSKEYWKYFANQEERYIMLIYTPQESTDKESSYAKSRYFIKQRSIQTYYKTKNSENTTALGMEHVNESYKPVVTDQGSTSKFNGYRICYMYLMKEAPEGSEPHWNKYAETYAPNTTESYFKANENKNTFEMQSGKKVNALCLSRNRDKNGNGIIDANEMDWYVPTYNQLSGMYLGATSLPSPMFTPPSHNNVISGDHKYHFMTSDNDKIWAEEGCSNGGDIKEAEEMRCVRNLGIEGYDSYNAPPEQPYTVKKENGNQVFYMDKIEESNLRSTKVTKALGFHSNFSDTRNKPYKKFELAKNTLSGSETRGGVYILDFYNSDKKDKCEEYTEPENPNKGTWRTPNQREMLIIYNATDYSNLQKDGCGMISCTNWEYDKSRIFTFRGKANNMYLLSERSTVGANEDTILRCVRDID